MFVDPDYTDRARAYTGTSNDYHPWGNLLVAEGFLAQVHDALQGEPAVGPHGLCRNFDEHGGFYDHVAPPACAQDDTELAGKGPHPDLKRLGFQGSGHRYGALRPAQSREGRTLRALLDIEMIEWR